MSVKCLQQASIEEYSRAVENGVTKVVIAHRLSTIKSANKIAFVRNGQVIEFGSHDVCYGCVARFIPRLIHVAEP